MPNYCRLTNHQMIIHKLNHHLLQKTGVTIVAIALYLSATIPQKSLANTPANPQLLSQSPAAFVPRNVSTGSQISLNGRNLSGAWLQQLQPKNPVKIYISDAALRQLLGIDLLSTNNPGRQPIEWFSSNNQPLILSANLWRGYRYLDVTNLATAAGWQMQAQGNTLVIVTPSTQVRNISENLNPGSVPQIVLDLDRPTPWQIQQGLPIKTLQDDPNAPTPNNAAPTNREWKITLDAIADSSLIQRYTPPPATSPDLLKQSQTSASLIQKVEVVNNQTVITLSVPLDLSLQATTINNPHRLVLNLRPDALKPKNINWARGLQWRQDFVNLGTDRFGIVWLEVNPRTAGLAIKPIWATANTLVGTAPLIQTAQKDLAVAAINAGYFNRNNRLPLGAIRRDGQWLSSPILNRGAIAWNDAGQFYFGRLTLQETLTTSSNLRSPILFLNSGYVQSGIARYTPAWGQTYTSLTDNERVFIVQNNKVTNQFVGDKAGQTNFPIPPNSYLLVFRGNAISQASQLTIGTDVQITTGTTPGEFNRYPNIVGAGPLLLQNGKIVLDAQSEQFSNAFITQKASRSAICTTANNTVLIAAVHNRVGGSGPTLAEHAQLMKLLGCVNALNLDGGSSTSLYLGGQLLDRYPNTAARVHNGIGIFLQPR
ncbi:hypothetical protein CLI64_22000 [Nostoc sp. CENA543]|uniref:phosphodiester glycosidase family protein n=1 Tax=Nostoc sp. CENA543 TaxID=1869241 RepID=UPI000CA1C62E|nr:phosphodiester glycosidase family protein [Nostoc sp. CENA543]AUT02859.1 hypothetical protein CLI64_22000 [Nostoc sp. CENA543]